MSEIRLKLALAELTDCFLEKHGCFPLDNQRWRDAMKEAYNLIGQPGTEDRSIKVPFNKTATSTKTGEEE